MFAAGFEPHRGSAVSNPLVVIVMMLSVVTLCAGTSIHQRERQFDALNPIIPRPPVVASSFTSEVCFCSNCRRQRCFLICSAMPYAACYFLRLSVGCFFVVLPITKENTSLGGFWFLDPAWTYR